MLAARGKFARETRSRTRSLISEAVATIPYFSAPALCRRAFVALVGLLLIHLEFICVVYRITATPAPREKMSAREQTSNEERPAVTTELPCMAAPPQFGRDFHHYVVVRATFHPAIVGWDSVMANLLALSARFRVTADYCERVQTEVLPPMRKTVATWMLEVRLAEVLVSKSVALCRRTNKSGCFENITSSCSHVKWQDGVS